MTASVLLASRILIMLVGAIYVVVQPRINQWGAADQEHQSTWPGDQLVARPSFVWTNAITIKAPAAKVWPWLVQLGQGRGGLYSYDWLENLLGCDVHSTDRILPAFQTPLRVGDRVIRMARYAPHAPVAVFEPQRALVLGHKQRAQQGGLTPSRSDAEPPRPGLLPERRDLVLTDPKGE